MVNTMPKKMAHTKQTLLFQLMAQLLLGKDGALTSTSTHPFTPGTTNLVDAFSSHNCAY